MKLDLNKIAVATSGEVVTQTSERNRLFYERILKEFKSNDPKYRAKDPEGAALQMLVKKSIEWRNYILYATHINRAEEILPIGKYDIIVTFNAVGEPRFGFLRDNDGEPAMEVSTPEGNRLFDL